MYCFFRLLSIAEETLAEFLSKATGTAVEWVQMPGMKVFHEKFALTILLKNRNNLEQTYVLVHKFVKNYNLVLGYRKYIFGR